MRALRASKKVSSRRFVFQDPQKALQKLVAEPYLSVSGDKVVHQDHPKDVYIQVLGNDFFLHVRSTFLGWNALFHSMIKLLDKIKSEE